MYRNILDAERKVGRVLEPLHVQAISANRVIGHLVSHILALCNRLPQLCIIAVQPAEMPESGAEQSVKEPSRQEKRPAQIRYSFQIRPLVNLPGSPAGAAPGQPMASHGGGMEKAGMAGREPLPAGRQGRGKKVRHVTAVRPGLPLVPSSRISVMDISSSLAEHVHHYHYAQQSQWISQAFSMAPSIHTYAVLLPDASQDTGFESTQKVVSPPGARGIQERGDSRPPGAVPGHGSPGYRAASTGSLPQDQKIPSFGTGGKKYVQYISEIRDLLFQAFTGGIESREPVREPSHSGFQSVTPEFRDTGIPAPSGRREPFTITVPSLSPGKQEAGPLRTAIQPMQPPPGKTGAGGGVKGHLSPPSSRPFALYSLFRSNPPVPGIRNALQVTGSLRKNLPPFSDRSIQILSNLFPKLAYPHLPMSASPAIPGGAGTDQSAGIAGSTGPQRPGFPIPAGVSSPPVIIVPAIPGGPVPPHANMSSAHEGGAGYPGSSLPMSLSNIIRLSQATQAAFHGARRPVMASLQTPGFKVFQDHTSILLEREGGNAGLVRPSPEYSSREPADRSGFKTAKFENVFNISVNMKGGENEGDLRDLGRKIGTILSDELRRYGRYPWR
jgi:hypothetical protein